MSEDDHLPAEQAAGRDPLHGNGIELELNSNDSAGFFAPTAYRLIGQVTSGSRYRVPVAGFIRHHFWA